MIYREFCQRFLAIRAAHDFDTLATMLTDDFVIHEAPGLPHAGDYRGIEGWRALSATLSGIWDGFRVTGTEFFGETDDSLVLRHVVEGRSRNTGIAFKTTVLELWQFRDGALREITPFYWDTQALAALNT